MRRFMRALTAWLWEPELVDLERRAMSAERERTLLQLNMDTLVDLFREKQGKISRLQGNYVAKTAPHREDLRGERPMLNYHDHLTLLAMAPGRQERMRKLKLTGKPSDGTVEGVPFDQPNIEVEEAFDSPLASMSPQPVIARRVRVHGEFTAAGADPNATG